MFLNEAYSAKAIAVMHNEAASNKIAYLGEAFFPVEKKAGLDLKYIVTSNGLPVSLAPGVFDTQATIRSRNGFKMTETEMAYFDEEMIISEKDEQEILRAQDAADPYAVQVLKTIYNDAETLIDGAAVVPERMRMSLLTSCTSLAGPSISIQTDKATYAYNYDPDGTYKTNNYVELTGTDVWSDTTNSNPMEDIAYICNKAQEDGTKVAYMLISSGTMAKLKANTKIRAMLTLAQNAQATFITDAKVKQLIKDELDVTVVVYTKLFKTENGTTQKFIPDGRVAFLPEGAVGKTWFGTTPIERKKQTFGLAGRDADIEIVDTGVAVEVRFTDNPIHTETEVQEICLPSFERMFETYQLKAF